MRKRLEVVNLCSNQILVQGIKNMFTACEEIGYSHATPNSTEPFENTSDADVYIMEDSCIADPSIQAKLGKSSHGTVVYINLNRNEVTIECRKQVCLNSAHDLFELVWKCGSVCMDYKGR